MSAAKLRLIRVGTISGAHGVRGDVKIQSYTSAPEDCLRYGPLLSEDGKPLIEAKSSRPAKKALIVTPKTPRQKEEWDQMSGTGLFVPRDAFDPPDDDDDFYIEDLIGLSVVTPEGEILGRVHTVQDHGAGPVIEVTPFGDDKTFLVPFTREDIPHVDMDAGELVLATAELWASI